MKAGTQIVCTEGHPICKIGRDGLPYGATLDTEWFTDWQIEPWKAGEPATCPKCGAHVFESHSPFGTRAMTTDGWRYADEYLDKARQHEIKHGIEGIR